MSSSNAATTLFEDKDRALLIVAVPDGTAGRSRYEISCDGGLISLTATQMFALMHAFESVPFALRAQTLGPVRDHVVRSLARESVV